MESAYGFKGRYLIAENGNRIKGILPLIHIKPPLLSGILVSLPYCDAGGLLADSPEIEKQLLLKALETALRRFNRWNPNMMLYWAFLKYAADHHFPMFDFGRSTPGEGTYSFKKQWGAKPSPLHWADFTPALGNNNHPLQPITQPAKSAVSGKREKVESLIMKMPVPVSKMFGTMTRKYISL